MQKIIIGVCLGLSSTCWGGLLQETEWGSYGQNYQHSSDALNRLNRQQPKDETQDLSCSKVESKFYLHVPALRFLAARGIAARDVQGEAIKRIPCKTVRSQNVRKYASWIKKVVAYNDLKFRSEPIDEKEFPDSYDCPDDFFYRIGSRFDLAAKYRGTPLTFAALIKHGVSFYPEDLFLKDARQDIPDMPVQALQCVQRGDISPQCALIKAACLDHPETIKELVIQYAFSDLDKKRAFNIAVVNNSLACCQVLFDGIANFDLNKPFRISGGFESCFIHDAALRECCASAKFLLEHKSDPNVSLSGYRTPLDLASREGDLEMVRLLFKHGAKLDKESLEGVGVSTPYIRLKNVEKESKVKAAIIRELIKHGGDLETLSLSKQKEYRELLAMYPEESENIASSSTGRV